MLVALAFVVAAGAAVYSTWSPCGQSMLSQLNPLAERTRGQRYPLTATWYLLGGVAGGLTLGAVAAGLALLVDATDPGATTLVGVAAVACLVGAAVDGRVLPWSPPFFRRQVNENWLQRYRGWVYGAGFGWQVGAGVTTYIMTTAVLATVVLAALTGDALVALGVGATFGTVRGAAVFVTRRRTTFDSLAAFHRRFDALAPVVRTSVAVLLLVAGAITAVDAWGWIGGLAALVVAGAMVVVPREARQRASRKRSVAAQM